MKKISHWVVQHKTLLKTLFVAILSIIVSAELLSIAKTISFEQLTTLFKEIPFGELVR